MTDIAVLHAEYMSKLNYLEKGCSEISRVIPHVKTIALRDVIYAQLELGKALYAATKMPYSDAVPEGIDPNPQYWFGGAYENILKYIKAYSGNKNVAGKFILAILPELTAKHENEFVLLDADRFINLMSENIFNDSPEVVKCFAQAFVIPRVDYELLQDIIINLNSEDGLPYFLRLFVGKDKIRVATIAKAINSISGQDEKARVSTYIKTHKEFNALAKLLDKSQQRSGVVRPGLSIFASQAKKGVERGNHEVDDPSWDEFNRMEKRASELLNLPAPKIS